MRSPDSSPFPVPDPAIWLEKVKAELKDRSLESCDYTWDDIRISPFEFLPEGGRKLVEKKNNRWQTGSYIDPGTENHGDLLKALNEGASVLYIEFQKEEDWKKWFKEVRLDWISLHLTFENTGILDSFLKFPDTVTHSKITGSVRVKNVDPVKLFHNYAERLPAMRFLCFDLKELKTSKSLAALFAGIAEMMENLSPGVDSNRLAEQVAIHVYGQNDMVLNISILRALRLLWRQLFLSAGLENKTDLFLAGHIKNDQTTTCDHQIRASVIAASMILGGIDELFIEGTNKAPSRYGRMIQHVFREEALLGVPPDPLSGARVVEKLTGTIAEKVWKEYSGLRFKGTSKYPE